MTTKEASMSVSMISLLVTVAWVGVEDKRRHSHGSPPYCLPILIQPPPFGRFKEYTPGIHSSLHNILYYNHYQSTTPRSQSSRNKYGLWFQKSSPIISQCSSAILVDSCLVLWVLFGLGDVTPFSDPMVMRFCCVKPQMLENRRAPGR